MQIYQGCLGLNYVLKYLTVTEHGTMRVSRVLA